MIATFLIWIMLILAAQATTAVPSSAQRSSGSSGRCPAAHRPPHPPGQVQAKYARVFIIGLDSLQLVLRFSSPRHPASARRVRRIVSCCATVTRTSWRVRAARIVHQVLRQFRR